MRESVLAKNDPIREQFTDRTEVLKKVKKLLALPQSEVMTIRQIADFYEVGIETIQSCYKENKSEIDADGVLLKPYEEILTALKDQLCVHDGKTIISLDNGVKIVIPKSKVRVFPQCAIIRMGMFLQEESPIAKEACTQLLNTLDT